VEPKGIYAIRPNRTGSVKVFHISTSDLNVISKKNADPLHAKHDSSEYRNINIKIEG